MKTLSAFGLLTCLAAVSNTACSEDFTTDIVCGEGAGGTLTAGGTVEITDSAGRDLVGAAISASDKTTIPASDITISCADDIVPPGYVALGPAVSFGPTGAASDYFFTFTLPYKAARLPEAGEGRHVRIVAKRHIGDQTPFFPPVATRMLDDDHAYKSRATFGGGELITYQVVAAENAGMPVSRQFTFRGIVGPSMGGEGSMNIGLRHHERFDAIANIGGETGPWKHYSMDLMVKNRFGGFCTAADEAAGRGAIGELCPTRDAFVEEGEFLGDFEHMLYQAGGGVGLTLNRDQYLKAFRDFARAFGNPGLTNIDAPYIPTGVPATYLSETTAFRCANPIVLNDVFDREYNPDGSLPVITFCDGNDSDALGLGIYDPNLPMTNPAEMLLAVDLNNNGVRDMGEPVLENMTEPYEDLGVDGLADQDETGILGAYDSATNPDPAGDNYHYLRNPLGTQNNLKHDDGEPWEDVGVDGIVGTCQQGETPQGKIAGCYDIGENDGVFTVSPGAVGWFENGLDALWANMTDDERRRVDLWFDAGIRDFMHNHISVNFAMSYLMSYMEYEGGIYDRFMSLVSKPSGTKFNVTEIDWSEIPRNVYVRYGKWDATDAEINEGDGRHAGSARQAINRMLAAFAWFDKRFPGGDRTPGGSGTVLTSQNFVGSNGRDTPYSVYLPPGYDDNPNLRYPVVYFLHGYGMNVNDLALIASALEPYMTDKNLTESQRWQKMIVVFADGSCRPGGKIPLSPDGDRCESGTFYSDHEDGGTAQMETLFLELMDVIDSKYRTKSPEIVDVPL